MPDLSRDYLGGVEVPEVELHLADGRVLKGGEACAATAAPPRGKQVPLTVPKNRHTHVNPRFAHSWFAVRHPGSGAEAMGDYLPVVPNLCEKARFEAFGYSVDNERLRAMIDR